MTDIQCPYGCIVDHNNIDYHLEEVHGKRLELKQEIKGCQS